jgi:anti-sigma factor RsiW
MTLIEALSCQELVELVTDYVEDGLSPEERRRFEEHLAECGHCLRYLEQLRETIRVAGSLSPEALDPAAEAVLLGVFRDWKAGRPAP